MALVKSFRWLFKKKRRVVTLLVATFMLSCFYMTKSDLFNAEYDNHRVVKKELPDFEKPDDSAISSVIGDGQRTDVNKNKAFSLSEIHNINKKTRTRTAMKMKQTSVLIPCYNVQAFYYPWYGNPRVDKKWLHWNHKYLPHWRESITNSFPKGAHKPPDDIASNFYPELGPYSSADSNTVEEHMRQLSFAGIGVVAISYYPPGQADDNGEDWQHLYPLILDTAAKYKIKIVFHIEPYKDRNEETVKSDIKHIITTYGPYWSFYKFFHRDQTLPVIYIYDSYHTKPQNWARILKAGKDSIRWTPWDAFVIGLVVEKNHLEDMVVAGFDGFYTYFAADGFTFGSTRRNWAYLNRYAKDHSLIFIPSIGPGYIDTRVRPWNDENTRKRLRGRYYEQSWSNALELNPLLVSITSFNEWHEGSQIEKAIPKNTTSYKYLDYTPNSSNFYLSQTKKNIEKYKQCARIAK